MFKSIFSDLDENQPRHLPLPHLQLNVKTREQTLKNLQDKIHYEQNLLQDKNASYVSILMKEYKSKLTSMRLKQMQEELKVKSSNFKSIFDDLPSENKENVRENKLNQKLREEYYKSYVLKPKEQENVKTMLRNYTRTASEPKEIKEGFTVRISNPQITQQTESEDKLKEYELLRMNQLEKQYNMFSNMLSDLFQENENLIEKTSDKFMCKNSRILEVLEPVVVGSIDLCAEDIAEVLIDEMLEEEVHFMNRLEEYQEAARDLMARTEMNHEDLIPEAKKRPLPYNLMKALKVLDELADDDDDY